MSWITALWSMIAGVCLTLAGIHFLVWLRGRDALANLVFSISAASAAVLAMQELALMRSQTPAQFAATLRWIHLPTAAIVIALVWFVRLDLGTGRRWLAWLISGLRLLVLVPNFVGYPNATFREVHSLDRVSLLGETLSRPVGEANPWRVLVHASMLLLLVYVVDAAIESWKRGGRRRPLVLGTTVVMALLLAALCAGLMVRGVLPGAFIAPAFLVIVLGMASEVSIDLLRARQLALDLYESEQRVSLATRAAELGLWEWDAERDEIWTSEVGRAHSGVSASGPSTFDRFLENLHPDDRKATRRAARRAIEGDGDFEAEFRTVAANGSTRWIFARGQLDGGGPGTSMLLRGVSMDITERRRTAAELREKRDGLIHMQRVAALGQLSLALAHELSQPLGAILRNAEAGELFLERVPPDLGEVKEILADIQRDEQRAAAVIDRMRSLLKRHELVFEPLAVAELLEQVAILLRSEIQARGAALEVSVPEDCPCVRGDRVHLQQVVVNLLLNSLDALETTPVGLRDLSIRASMDENGMLVLAVVDRGAGIEVDRLPHLFEPFFTTKSHGTGIGLAISKTIVQSHGGRIWAENNPGGGATVRFTLPVAERGGAP